LGRASSPRFTDFDNDGDLDIYLVNDEFVNPIGNRLWRNDGAGCNGWCFTQIAKEAGADSKLFGMGLAVGDYNNDGFQDFYFSNVGPMELLKNQAIHLCRSCRKCGRANLQWHHLGDRISRLR
jgi:enediyne biosynthesis protein E4